MNWSAKLISIICTAGMLEKARAESASLTPKGEAVCKQLEMCWGGFRREACNKPRGNVSLLHLRRQISHIHLGTPKLPQAPTLMLSRRHWTRSPSRMTTSPFRIATLSCGNRTTRPFAWTICCEVAALRQEHTASGSGLLYRHSSAGKVRLRREMLPGATGLGHGDGLGP